MAIATTETRGWPRALHSGLRRVERRLRRVATTRGVGTLALVLAAGLLLGMAVDLAAVLPQGVRWAMWLAYVAAGGTALIAGIVRPLVRKTRPTDLAAV